MIAGPLAPRLKEWVCGRSLAGIVVSNPAGAWMSVVSVVCCQVRQADHLPRGFLPIVVCLSVIVKPLP